MAGIRDGNWIDASIAGATTGLDALALLSDPLGSLLQYGVAWLIEHVRPLSEALDWLAGDPAGIAAQAQTWRNVATTLRDQGKELDRAIRWEAAGWSGPAADAYRAWAGQRLTATTALATAAETMAALVNGAGTLIAGVRTLVRDAIAVVVSRLIDYAVEEILSLGLATPLVVEQAATLCASWAARIVHWLRALIASLGRLRGMAGALGETIESLVARIRPTPDVGTLNRVRKRGAGAAQYFRLDVARSVAEKYGIDLTGLDVSLGDVKHRGFCRRTNPARRIWPGRWLTRSSTMTSWLPASPSPGTTRSSTAGRIRRTRTPGGKTNGSAGIEEEVMATFDDWLDAYGDTYDAIPLDAGIACPNCGHRTLRLVFTGDRERAIGYGHFWCDTCLVGIGISRAPIPEGAVVQDIHVRREEWEPRIPNYTLVS